MIDIGCNDGILLNQYPKNFINLIGIEPSNASKHIKNKKIKLVNNFFNYKLAANIFIRVRPNFRQINLLY